MKDLLARIKGFVYKHRKWLIPTATCLLVLVLVVSVFAGTTLRELYRDIEEDWEFADEDDDEYDVTLPDDFYDNDDNDDDDDEGEDVDSSDCYVTDPDRLNILIIGIDSPSAGERRAPLSDTIMVYSINKKTGNSVLMSIPRDFYVSIPGRRDNRINAAHAFGGASLLRRTVENLLDIEIHYFFRTNFSGFVSIIDMLGGVEIDVRGTVQHIRPGRQVLSGEDALLFVRSRAESGGDFARIARQQQLIVAVVRQIQANSLHRLPALIREGVKYVDTDMPLGKLIDFAQEFSQQDPEKTTRHVFRGTSFYQDGRYLIRPNMTDLRTFVNTNLKLEVDTE